MKKNTLLNVIILLFAFFIGAIGMYAAVQYIPVFAKKDGAQTVINKSEKEVTVTDKGIADSVEKLYDAVVVVGAYQNGRLFSSGTGFVYDEDDKYAYILTNSHVVEDSTSIKVKFTNDSVETVELVGNDSYSDIAVLKIEKEKVIKVATLGNNDNSRLGDTVFTIGAPISDEYSWTVTRGILSNKDRLIEVNTSSASDWVINVLQTDAAINSGNSGGPLANSNGEVIGITNMKLISSGVEGIGFAIPIEDAINYATQLREKGKIDRPFIGISMLNSTDTYALAQYRISVPNDVTGAVVMSVEASSPADKAGLKIGDVVTAIGDYEVTSVAKLKYYLYKFNPNDEVTLKYVRDGKTETAKLKLAKSE